MFSRSLIRPKLSQDAGPRGTDQQGGTPLQDQGLLPYRYRAHLRTGDQGLIPPPQLTSGLNLDGKGQHYLHYGQLTRDFGFIGHE